MKLHDFGLWIRKYSYFFTVGGGSVSQNHLYFSSMSVEEFESSNCCILNDGASVIYSVYETNFGVKVRMVILPSHLRPPITGVDWLYDGNAWCTHLEWSDIVRWD